MEKYCENCGAKLQDGSGFCPDCGAKIEYKESGFVYCPNCGKQVSKEFEFCTECGSKIKVEEFASQKKGNPAKKKGFVSIGLCVVLVVAVIFGGAVVVKNLKVNTNKEELNDEVERKDTISGPRKDHDGNIIYDCISFGRYPQSDSYEEKPIKWRVLSVDGNDALLIADKSLDMKAYNEEYGDATWDTCTLRSWLNGYGGESNECGIDYTNESFINCAFTNDERNAIFTTTLENEDNVEYEVEGGEDTKDKIFLLSYEEATNPNYGFSYDNEYDNTRRREETTYITGGDSKYWCWWLRSPGWGSDCAMFVNEDGYVRQPGSCNGGKNDVCPALHLNLSFSDLYSYEGTIVIETGTTDDF